VAQAVRDRRRVHVTIVAHLQFCHITPVRVTVRAPEADDAAEANARWLGSTAFLRRLVFDSHDAISFMA